MEVEYGSLTLNDLTLQYGSISIQDANDPLGGGGLLEGNGDVQLNRVSVSGNTALFGVAGAAAVGGGIDVAGGTLDLSDCDITDNVAIGTNGTSGGPGGPAYGGGLYDSGGTVDLSGGTSFTSNQARGGSGGGTAAGGGLYDTGGAVSVASGSRFSDNVAQAGDGDAGSDGSNGANGTYEAGDKAKANGGNGNAGTSGYSGGEALGGGIFVTNGGGSASLTLAGTAFVGNDAQAGDGGSGGDGGRGGNGGYTFFGIVAGRGGNGGAGSAGAAGGQAIGGALYINSGSVAISGSTLAGNVSRGGHGGSGGSGGHGGNGGAKTTLGHRYGASGGNGGNGSNGGNGGEAQGGGIFNDSGTITLVNSTLAGNEAASGRGSAGGAGGHGGQDAFHSYSPNYGSSGSSGGDGNAANAYGGGLFASVGDVTLTNATIVENQAVAGAGTATDQATYETSYGGGLYVDGSTVTLANSIIAQNSSINEPDIYGTVNSLGYNLIGVVGSQTLGLIATDLMGTVDVPSNPDLGPLQDNGGPTQTLAPLAGSKAIDAGSVTLAKDAGLTTDQRGIGFGRFDAGTVDIGAVEHQTQAIQVSSGSGQSADTVAAWTPTWRLWSPPTARRSPGVGSITAPSTGASGTFDGGSVSFEATTNAQGIADPGPFVANANAGTYQVTATAAGGLEAGNFR